MKTLPILLLILPAALAERRLFDAPPILPPSRTNQQTDAQTAIAPPPSKKQTTPLNPPKLTSENKQNQHKYQHKYSVPTNKPLNHNGLSSLPIKGITHIGGSPPSTKNQQKKQQQQSPIGVVILFSMLPILFLLAIFGIVKYYSPQLERYFDGLFGRQPIPTNGSQTATALQEESNIKNTDQHIQTLPDTLASEDTNQIRTWTETENIRQQLIKDGNDMESAERREGLEARVTTQEEDQKPQEIEAK